MIILVIIPVFLVVILGIGTIYYVLSEENEKK